jgi:hypothetical protein
MRSNRKLDRPKLKLFKRLEELGAWKGYPICTFKHKNLYNKKEYTFEGYIIGEIVEDDFRKYKILTYDGKEWQKHKRLDQVQIIKPCTDKPKMFEVEI